MNMKQSTLLSKLNMKQMGGIINHFFQKFQ